MNARAHDTALVDMAGKRVGKLAVVERALNDNRGARWHCRCDCGGQCIEYGFHLRRLQRDGREDLARCPNCRPKRPGAVTRTQVRADGGIAPGDQFGRLAAVESDGDVWKLTCECGTEVTRTERGLYLVRQRGTEPMCKNCRARKSDRKNKYIGETFGKLTVISRVHRRAWKCRCECGAVVERYAPSLPLTVKRGQEPKCLRCTKAHDAKGRAVGRWNCQTCCDLSHRRQKPTCPECGEEHRDEEPVALDGWDRRYVDPLSGF